ncbi:MAG: hypothetical protein B7X34_11070, partial [Acidobacteriia bacterium 12-62-4]
LAGPAAAQLTVEQKLADFQSLVSLYAKQYAPYEWKRDTQSFDLYNVAPWVDRIRKTTDDLDYLQILGEYVAGLNDIHASYATRSTFVADLHLYTDIYDGRVLIEQIDRFYLPASRFPFEVGDEVVQFDGRPVMEVVRELARTVKFANERSTLRYAADLLVYRPQAILPLAPRLGESSTLLIRRADGSEASHTIRWDKTGYPVTKLGPVPNVPVIADAPDNQLRPEFEETERQPFVMNKARRLRARLENNVVPGAMRHLTGFGSRAPVFRLPENFVQRLGRNRADYFYSGTFEREGKRIGYIRISDFQPVDFSLLSVPLRQWATEIAYLKANTDGLVVDVMRNPGGYGCYGAELMGYLTTKPYFTFGNELRPTLEWVQSFYETAQLTVDDGLEPWEGKPLPFCSASLDVLPPQDRFSEPLGYNKPILLLVDEFSTSAGDIFAAMAQDNGIAKLYGYRTAGAGGTVTESLAGFYSEGSARTTVSLLTRARAYTAPGYPTTSYIENIGIHPDFPADYMTRDNLMNRGAAFVDGFSRTLLDLITGEAKD